MLCPLIVNNPQDQSFLSTAASKSVVGETTQGPYTAWPALGEGEERGRREEEDPPPGPVTRATRPMGPRTEAWVIAENMT